MLPQTLMEDKQLDFYQPLLSVRRFSSTVVTPETDKKEKSDISLPKIPPLPVYKSELKSGPVRNPGKVPFIWEQTPGRPKDESRSQTRALERPPIAPKLPPGRGLNVKHQLSENCSDGKRVTPSQVGNSVSSSPNVSSSDKNAIKNESYNQEMETKSSGSDVSDEAYVDALDTLSRTESFFLNCSVSGISGLDDPDVRSYGDFSTDPHARDFMIGRFLPAAKAMASETPPHATRKQPIAQEQPRQIKKVANVDKQRPLSKFSSNDVPHYLQDNGWEDSEDEDDHNRSKDSSAKVCGLFPQFLLKSSFCLLNPVTGMKMQAHKPVSVRRIRAKSSYLGCETKNEHFKGALHERGSTGGVHMDQRLGFKNELNGKPSQIIQRSDFQKQDGSSIYRRLQGNDITPYQKELTQSINQENGHFHSPEMVENYMEKGIDTHKQGTSSFGELLASEDINLESGFASPVIEKTLYIDSLQKVRSPDSHTCDTMGLAQDNGENFEILVKGMENLVLDEKAILQGKSADSMDSSSLFSVDKSIKYMQMDSPKYARGDQNLMEDSNRSQCPVVAENGKLNLESQLNTKLSDQETTFTSSKVAASHGNIDLDGRLPGKSSNRETSHGRQSQLPLAPPLPKSPSESWLQRTLPTVSSKHSSSRSTLGIHNYSRTHASTSPSADLKWETIVRTSNVQVQHGHLRLSEELLTPIPEA